MRETHSPAPWTIGEDTTVEGMGATLIMSAASARLEGPVIVAAVLGIDSRVYPEAGDYEANLRLSLAAPDLLAACRKALKSFEWINDLMGGDNFVSQRAALRAAISKAQPEPEIAPVLGGSISVEIDQPEQPYPSHFFDAPGELDQ